MRLSLLLPALLLVAPLSAQNLDRPPELIGGIDGLAEQIQYPRLAEMAGIEGIVFVQFTVDESGAVRDAEIARDVKDEDDLRDLLRERQGEAFDEEAFQDTLRNIRERTREAREAAHGGRKLEVIRSDKDGGLSEEALRVVRQARFEPGMSDGKPVAVQYTIPVKFVLPGEGPSDQ